MTIFLTLEEGNGELVIKPEDFRRPALYQMVPKVNLQYVTKLAGNDIIQDHSLKELQKIKFKMANTRNPFSRLYSAWNDKW